MSRPDIATSHQPVLWTIAVTLIGVGCAAVALALAAPSIGLGSSETFFLYVHFGISRSNLAMLSAFVAASGAVVASGIILYWPIDTHKAETTKPRLALRANYLGGCAIVCFITLEIALRLYLQVPVFTLRDWRGQSQGSQTSNSCDRSSSPRAHITFCYDPLLGWSHWSNFISDGFDTLAYGIRKNSDRDEQLTPGAVLAVGDSFTEGSEVVNEDTWPAQLERTRSAFA